MEYDSFDVATPDYRQRRRTSGYGTDERSPLVDVDVSPIDLTVSSERNVTVRRPPRLQPYQLRRRRSAIHYYSAR